MLTFAFKSLFFLNGSQKSRMLIEPDCIGLFAVKSRLQLLSLFFRDLNNIFKATVLQHTEPVGQTAVSSAVIASARYSVGDGVGADMCAAYLHSNGLTPGHIHKCAAHKRYVGQIVKLGKIFDIPL